MYEQVCKQLTQIIWFPSDGETTVKSTHKSVNKAEVWTSPFLIVKYPAY